MLLVARGGAGRGRSGLGDEAGPEEMESTPIDFLIGAMTMRRDVGILWA
jgi:hypothetical protein